MKKLLVFILFLKIFAQDITIQLKWKYQFQFAGFIMAKEKGFYQEEGVNVKLREYKPGIDIIKYVLNNKHTYGVGDSNLIYYISKGKKIELLMPIYKNTPFVLAVLNKKVKSLKDIEKQQIPISKFALTNPSVLAILKTEDINLNNLKTISQGNYFLDKEGVFAFYKSNELYDLKTKKIPYVLFEPKEYGIDLYGDILFTSQQNLLDNPEEVKKVINATKRGFEYAFSHIDETIDIILKKYNTSNLTYQKLKFEAEILKNMVSDFKFNKFRLKNIKNIFLILGIIQNRSFNVYDYVYTPFQVLSLKEKQFIKTHVIRCITTDKWEPFNLKEDGKIEGIAVDYWNIIKEKLHLRSYCKVVESWDDVLNAIKNKKADITLATTITRDRLKYAVFTKPYASYPMVIATRNDVGFIENIADLKGKLILVGKNYTSEKLLKENYPELNVKSVENIDKALKLVSEGKAFCAIDILPVIAYKINKYQYSNLKISGKTPFDFKVRFMIRYDYKELVPMINRVIDSITPAQKKEIYNKWVSVIYQDGLNYKYVKYLVVFGIVVFIVLFLVILFLRRDIKEKAKFEEKLEKLAITDSLTGIYNRYKLDKVLQTEIDISKRYERPFSLIFCDIDHFKVINDTFGHKIGDKVLKTISEIILENIRKSDVFGRWGGEEFLIISPETDLKKAIQLAEKLRKLIENYEFENDLLKVTCSFGVVEFNGEESISEITKRVDSLLYKAKNNGRNKVEF